MRLDVIDEKGKVTKRCVAKVFKTEAARAKDYLNEALTQNTAGLWAERFNEMNPPEKVSFVPVTVMEVFTMT